MKKQQSLLLPVVLTTTLHKESVLACPRARKGEQDIPTKNVFIGLGVKAQKPLKQKQKQKWGTGDRDPGSG